MDPPNGPPLRYAIHATMDPPDDPPLRYAIYAACLAGVVGNCCLLVATSQRPARLLKRQLFHAAIGNLIRNLAFAVLLTIGFFFDEDERDCIGNPNRPPFTPHLVPDLYLVLHGCFFASCAVEVHIAASISAASRRSPQTLVRLAFWLPAVWLFGLLSSLTKMIFLVTAEEFPKESDLYPVSVGYLILIFCLTLAFYADGIWNLYKSNSPSVVIRRTVEKVSVYPFIFLVVMVPVGLRYLGVIKYCSRLDLVSVVCEQCYGLLQAIAYMLLNRQAFCCFSCCCRKQEPNLARLLQQGTDPREVSLQTGQNLDAARRAAPRVSSGGGLANPAVGSGWRHGSAGGTSGAAMVGFAATVDQKTVSYGSWRNPFQWAGEESYDEGSISSYDVADAGRTPEEKAVFRALALQEQSRRTWDEMWEAFAG